MEDIFDIPEKSVVAQQYSSHLSHGPTKCHENESWPNAWSSAPTVPLFMTAPLHLGICESDENSFFTSFELIFANIKVVALEIQELALFISNQTEFVVKS